MNAAENAVLVDMQQQVKELRQQRDVLGQALLDCKAIAEQTDRPPSARLESVRDRSTPVLVAWLSERGEG